MKALLLPLLAALVLVGCGDYVVEPLDADASLNQQTVDDAALMKRTFTTDLTGEAEIPGPGDPDGFGQARVTLDRGTSTICFGLAVRDIEPATAAHIHEGRIDESGGVVVGLEPPTDGRSEGCVTGIDRDLLRAIGTDPAGYYVNVHNAEYPGGALRGQLAVEVP